MIAGDPQMLAIESDISDASGHWVLGYFTVHVAGQRFGVHAPDATMLANSVNEVAARLARRGTHRVDNERVLSAREIAGRYLCGAYRDDPSEADRRFVTALHDARAIWAPDGDEAFDDGSHILQFDGDGQVRIVALRNGDDLEQVLAGVVDIEMPEARFYGVLADWHHRFTAELEQRRRPN